MLWILFNSSPRKLPCPQASIINSGDKKGKENPSGINLLQAALLDRYVSLIISKKFSQHRTSHQHDDVPPMRSMWCVEFMIEYPSAAVDVFTQHTDTTGAAAAHEHRERKTKIKAPPPSFTYIYILHFDLLGGLDACARNLHHSNRTTTIITSPQFKKKKIQTKRES